MERLPKATPKPQAGGRARFNPKKARRGGASADPTPKGLARSAKLGAVGQHENYSIMRQAVVPGVLRLTSWATSLLGRAITVVTPPLSISVAHLALRYSQTENTPQATPENSFVNCDYNHLVVAGALMSGLSLSSRLGRSLQDASQALDKIATDYPDYKYMNPPHALKVELRGTKAATEKFIKDTLKLVFDSVIMSQAKDYFAPLNDCMKSEDESLTDYSCLETSKQYCQKRITEDIENDEKLKPLFEFTERRFLDICRPPGSHLFCEYVDAIPHKAIIGLRKAIYREKITLEAYGLYQYFYLCKVFKDNREQLAELVKKIARDRLPVVINELTREYDAKISSYLQMQASKLLAVQNGEKALTGPSEYRESQAVKHPVEVDTMMSLEVKSKKILAFQKAYYRLKKTRVNFNEFKPLAKAINTVIDNQELRETVLRLYKKEEINEAIILAQKYTVFDPSQ